MRPWMRRQRCLIQKSSLESCGKAKEVFSESFHCESFRIPSDGDSVFVHLGQFAGDAVYSEGHSFCIFAFEVISALEHELLDVFLDGVSFPLDIDLTGYECQIRVHCCNNAEECGYLPQVLIPVLENGVDVSLDYAYEDKCKDDRCRKECEVEEVFYGSDYVFHTANIVKILDFLIFAPLTGTY